MKYQQKSIGKLCHFSYSSNDIQSYSGSKIDLDDPTVFRPTAYGLHIDLVFQQAICAGWLIKHRPPTFAFIKSSKKRFVVLVDRMLYTFKSDSPNTYREFFEITKDTHAYVTDHMTGVHYCIEVRKRGQEDQNSLWLLQSEDVETMKMWLNYIKRVIAWLKAEHTGHISRKNLEAMETKEDYRLSSNPVSPTPSSSLDYYPSSITSCSTSDSVSRKSIQRMNPTLLPPQLPPPKSLPPPVPSSYACL